MTLDAYTRIATYGNCISFEHAKQYLKKRSVNKILLSYLKMFPSEKYSILNLDV